MTVAVADFDYQLDINLGVHLLGRVDRVGRGVTRIKTRARPPNQSMRTNERGGESSADRCECAIHTTALQRARHKPTVVIKIVVLGNQCCWELLHVRRVFKLKKQSRIYFTESATGSAQTWLMAAGKLCSQFCYWEKVEVQKLILLSCLPYCCVISRKSGKYWYLSIMKTSWFLILQLYRKGNIEF